MGAISTMIKRRITFVILILSGFFLVQGCSYWQNRARDCGEMVDVGFSFSKKAQLALFYDFIPIVPIGYGRVDGEFVGLGGGRLCWFSPHFERSYGLILWGQEEVTFHKSLDELERMSREERDDVLNYQRSGLVGMIDGPFPGPDYLISCPHYIHLGWIGVVASPRYLEMLDFVLGFTTLDIGWDDLEHIDDKSKNTDS